MSKSSLLSTATLIGCAVVIMAHLSGAHAATPKKAKAAARAAPVTSLMCEGTTSRTATNGFAGETRNERQLTFAAQLRLASLEAQIMGVNGSIVLKPGRHVMTKDESAYLITIPFTDFDGSPDSLRMWIHPSGEFSAYSTLKAPRNPARDLMCGLMGQELCSISEVEMRVEMSGMCWPAK